MKFEPKKGVPIYHAQSGHDFALADITVKKFSAMIRGMLSDELAEPVLAVIVRWKDSQEWQEISRAPLPGLCVDDIHEMAKLWQKQKRKVAGSPKCYAEACE